MLLFFLNRHAAVRKYWQPIKFADHENLLRVLRKVYSPKMDEFKKWAEQKVEEAMNPDTNVEENAAE